MTKQRAIVAARRLAEQSLMAFPNVAGVATGSKFKGGKDTKEPSVVVYVRKKILELASNDTIPKSIDGIATDVVELDLTTMESPPAERRKRVSPLSGGCSIGNANYSSGGTLGALLRMKDKPERVLAITCYHVLCPTGNNTLGQSILQPSKDDGGDSSSKIGTLCGYSLRDGMDVAFTDVTLAQQSVNKIYNGPQIAGLGRNGYGEVRKYGKTTDQTTGQIVKYDLTYRIEYKFGQIIEHTDLLLIKSSDNSPFVRGGDSGAFLLNSRNEAIGIMIGGDEQQGYGVAIRLRPIVEHFGLML